MFGLFKKKPEPTPWEPEKPVRELFEAVKDDVIRADRKYEGEDYIYNGISFEFNGMNFKAHKYFNGFYHSVYLESAIDYGWLKTAELDWLFFNLESYITEKERELKNKKRQEFIDALCHSDS